MDRRFRQTRGILRIEAELLPAGLRYMQRGLLTSHETQVPYEQVPDELTRFFHVNRWYLFICVFFGFLLVARVYATLSSGSALMRILPSVIWFLVAVGGTWMQSARYVGYRTFSGGFFFFDVRGSQDPTEFLQAIQQAKESHLRREAEQASRTYGFRSSAG